MLKSRIGILFILIGLVTGCENKNYRYEAIVLEEVQGGEIEKEAGSKKEIESEKEVEIKKAEETKKEITIEQEEGIIQEIGTLKKIETVKEVEKDLLAYFKGYFDLNLEERLNLNQEKSVALEDFHLPRLLEINYYVTLETEEVEKVEVLSARSLGENKVYEVEITTREKVIDSLEANKRFKWSSEEGYYIKSENHKEETFKSSDQLGEALRESYLFLQDGDTENTDKIRIVHRYWVEVEPSTSFIIASIKEAGNSGMTLGYRKKASNNSHIRRIAYEENNKEHVEVIRDMLYQFFMEPKNFEKNYEEAYGRDMTPYPHYAAKIEVPKENIKVKSSLFGTQKQPRYNVTIPIKILTKNNQIDYVCYAYLVGFENEKIEFINFLEIKPITVEEYDGLTIE